MPTWTPVYSAEFLEPIAANLLATIKRDAPAALAWANGGTALADFKTWKTTNVGRVDTKFPVLAVLGFRTVPVFADDEREQIGEAHELRVEMALTGKNEAELTSECFKYVRAVAHIILGLNVASRQRADLLAGTSIQKAEIEIEDIDYDTIRDGGTKYVRAPFIDVTIRVIEE